MTVYSDYTADEQQLLRASLEAAAVAVSAASPGRKEETVSEGVAAATLVLESGPAYVRNTLVTSVVLALEARVRAEEHFPDYGKIASAPDARLRSMNMLRSVSDLLDAKATPDEAAGYKGWLFHIARVTAEAGKEDQGFLGMGGVKVNDAERTVLQEIAELLGVES